MRLFIAVNLTQELQKSVTETLHELKKKGVKGSYVPAKNLHLTLAFIGEQKNAEAVIEAMKTISYNSFSLSFSEMGSFGDLLWIGAKGKQGLSRLVKDIRDALDAAQIPYDRKKFVPHITIIRKMNGKWQQVKPPKGEMKVTKISLMRSDVKDGKRIYTEIFSV